MACTRPLTLFYDGVDQYGKKHTVKIARADDSDHDYAMSKGWLYIRIPCGQCAACRLQKAREWANRVMLENTCHESGYFVTLTYCDSALFKHCASDRLEYSYTDVIDVSSIVHTHVDDGKSQVVSNLSCISDPDSGDVIGESLSLNKVDWQLFMKRLRQELKWHGKDDPIRFFMCGEYGSQTWRPHYHALIWMKLPADDLILYKTNELHQMMYCSKILFKLWPYGLNVVAPITWESACYVARYTMKKYTGPDSDAYAYAGLLPPFTLMSRKPGIAGLCDLDEIFSKDRVVLPSSKPGKVLQFVPPKYLENLFEVCHPEEIKQRREARARFSDHAEKIVLSKTDLSLRDYYQNLENNLDKAHDVLYNFRNKV